MLAIWVGILLSRFLVLPPKISFFQNSKLQLLFLFSTHYSQSNITRSQSQLLFTCTLNIELAFYYFTITSLFHIVHR